MAKGFEDLTPGGGSIPTGGDDDRRDSNPRIIQPDQSYLDTQKNPGFPIREKRLGTGPRIISPPVRTQNRALREDLYKGQTSLETYRYKQWRALNLDGTPVSIEDYLRLIKLDTEINIKLKTIDQAFQPLVVTVQLTPTLVLPPEKRFAGYSLINPSDTSFQSNITFFSSASRAVGDYFSSAFNTLGTANESIFIDYSAGTGSLTIDVQSQDQISLNWVTVQSLNIVVVQTRLIAIDSPAQLGNFLRIHANVGTAAVTFSVSGVQKGAGLKSGQNVYLGGPSVNSTHGFPLLPGQREDIWLMDNTPIYAVTIGNPVTMKVFRRQ